MNGLDLLIALSAASAAAAGFRVGLLARVLSWVGLLLGLLIAAQNMPAILAILGDPPPGKAGIEVAVVLFAASVVGKGAGMTTGRWLHRRLPLRPMRHVDRLSGAALGLAGVAIVTWLALPLMGQLPGWPAEQARRSAIGRAVDTYGPPPPAALLGLRGWMAFGSFPQVVDVLRPTPSSGEVPATSPLAPDLIEKVSASVVLVQGQACRYIESGTGFVVAPGRVVTNAHVVAGATAITVTGQDGERRAARLRAFDADRDLALLSIGAADLPSLAVVSSRLDSSAADNGSRTGSITGDDVAVFGHPGGGDLRVTPARIRARVDATGRDIYDDDRSIRSVLVLSARLRSGDSGSPVVDGAGRVVGVSFAVAPDDSNTAYALASIELRAFLADPPASDDTGPCLTG